MQKSDLQPSKDERDAQGIPFYNAKNPTTGDDVRQRHDSNINKVSSSSITFTDYFPKSSKFRMENAQTIKLLIKRRGTKKAQITSFALFLREHQEGSTTNIVKIRTRLNKFKETIGGLGEICDDLDRLDEEVDHTDERITMEDQALDLISEAEILLAAANPRSNTPITIDSEDGHANSNRAFRVKLPEASLPKFDGKYEQWLGFKDAFTAMIRDRQDISNVGKLQYLKASLSGDAAQKLNIFTITGDNYTRAWELLEQSYQDERIIISRHLSLLIRMPSQDKETATGLTRLADETQQHVLSLKSLGVDVGEHIIVQLVVEKLHKTTRQKWDETLQRGVFPPLAKLIDFLYATASRIAQWESEGRGDSKDYSSTEKSTKNSKSVKTFATTAEGKCLVCAGEAHPLYKCAKFRDLPVQSRIKMVKDASLCLNCLRSHKSKECKFRNCLKCSEKHNTLLHKDSDTASASVSIPTSTSSSTQN